MLLGCSLSVGGGEGGSEANARVRISAPAVANEPPALVRGALACSADGGLLPRFLTPAERAESDVQTASRRDGARTRGPRPPRTPRAAVTVRGL